MLSRGQKFCNHHFVMSFLSFEIQWFAYVFLPKIREIDLLVSIVESYVLQIFRYGKLPPMILNLKVWKLHDFRDKFREINFLTY